MPHLVPILSSIAWLLPLGELPPLASVEKSLAEWVELPTADMAQPVTSDIVRSSIVVAIDTEGSFRIVDLASESKSVEGPLDRDELHSHLERFAAAPLASGTPTHDSMGLSTKHVLFFADRSTPVLSLARAMYQSSARGVMIPNLWIVAENAKGDPGVLSIRLPIDLDIAPSDALPICRGNLTIDAEHDDGIQRATDLYPAFHAWWSAHPDERLQLKVRSEPGQPTAALVAVINECRRFGIGFTLRGFAPDVTAEPVEQTYFSGLGAPAEGIEVPPLTKGRALAGDPMTNPTSNGG